MPKPNNSRKRRRVNTYELLRPGDKGYRFGPKKGTSSSSNLGQDLEDKIREKFGGKKATE